MAEEPRIALVTGANRGLGFEVCRQLAEKGIHPILTSRDTEKGQKATEQLRDEGFILSYEQLDVSDPAGIERILDVVEQKFERLEILINNAAVHYDNWQRAEGADIDVVQEALITNLLGPWRLCKAFIPMMRRQGYGRIVNVSSGDGSLSSMGGGTPAYGISKAALNALTIKLAEELKDTGILINAVDPGWARTDMGGPEAPRSPKEGAESIIWAATLSLDGPTGGFFRDGEPISW